MVFDDFGGMNPANRSLIEAFCDGGFAEGFEVLWQFHQLRLWRFIHGRICSEDQAEDVFQDVAFKLFRYLSNRVVAMFPPVAFKISKDELADFFRGYYRQ